MNSSASMGTGISHRGTEATEFSEDKKAIQQRAEELGFDACHFATAAPPETARQFENWLAAKRHGEMGYLERNAHKRVNPQEVLPGAKSVIVLAASYTEAFCVWRVASSTSADPSSDATRHTQHGVVARYARFK